MQTGLLVAVAAVPDRRVLYARSCARALKDQAGAIHRSVRETSPLIPAPLSHPRLPLLQNCLVVGDSVSIGYTGVAAQHAAGVCQLQHGPWDTRDGGAGSTAVGQACLNNFLVTQRQTPVKWEANNFG